MLDNPFLDRRTLFGVAVAASAAGLVPAPAQSAGASAHLNLRNPADKGRIYRKLAWSLGQDFGAWSLRGTRSAMIGADITPLWDMHYGALFQIHDLPDGSFEVATISLQFYTDIKTGEFVRKFVNPVTGIASEIQYRPLKVFHMHYDDGGVVDPKSDFSARSAAIGDPIVEGGQVWMREDQTFKGPVGKSGKPFRGNDMTTYSASTAVMNDSSIRMAPAQQAFIDVVDWPAWLGMGDLQGCTMSRNYGYKVAKIDQMSEPLVRLTKQLYPDLYRDPFGALKA